MTKEDYKVMMYILHNKKEDYEGRKVNYIYDNIKMFVVIACDEGSGCYSIKRIIIRYCLGDSETSKMQITIYHNNSFLHFINHFIRGNNQK